MRHRARACIFRDAMPLLGLLAVLLALAHAKDVFTSSTGIAGLFQTKPLTRKALEASALASRCLHNHAGHSIPALLTTRIFRALS